LINKRVERVVFKRKGTAACWILTPQKGKKKEKSYPITQHPDHSEKRRKGACLKFSLRLERERTPVDVKRGRKKKLTVVVVVKKGAAGSYPRKRKKTIAPTSSVNSGKKGTSPVVRTKEKKKRPPNPLRENTVIATENL